ncbi:MAG: MFS transporter [Candidatus Abyssobacteria bacterium SURF_5]|uniref:MFS transporter n=1 Tax=Abyssobacteria bacterium (strain SURF_5) TaxID=2093360 RepID=A0A3A4NXE1_ABYX5|nr:MAG: MFS transporter [Candidatus Abyssubacteria bacterium SURF_5]
MAEIQSGKIHVAAPSLEAREKLRLSTHVCYGVSQFGLNCIGTAFGINALFFYTTVLRFDSVLFGIIMLIGQAWDAISDPLMGHLSDNTNWKRGRRRPFIILGAVPFSVAFFLVFSPPALSSQNVIFIYLLAAVLLMFTARTVFETPYNALAPELTPDYDERTKLSGFRQFFGTIGDAQGAILPLLLVSLFHEHRKPAHFVYGLFAALITIILAEITRRGTFEKPSRIHRSQVSVVDSFIAMSRNRPYLIFIFSSTVAQMSNNIVTYLVLFVTKYWFLNEALATRFFAFFFIGCVLAVPLWVKLSNLLGKKWTYILDLTGYGVLLSGILFLSKDAHLAATVVMFFAGMFNVGLWILSGTIAPDIIEWDEYHTGKRREGVYAGVWTFMYKAGIGLALMIVGFALKLIDFNADLPAQSASTLFKLRILFGPIPALFLIAGALVFLLYPITKSKHQEIRRLILQRRQNEQP